MNRKQSGMALLMAMLVVTIAAVTAVALSSEQSFSIRLTGNLQQNNTALMYATGLEDYARLFLHKDAKNSKTDHLEEDWAQEIPVLPIEGGFLAGTLSDASARINLNSVLGSEQAAKTLVQLCQQLEISGDFVPALKDWIDENQISDATDGAEDDYYTSLDIPYRTANRFMTDASELRLIKGVDAELYNTLRPYIVALPEKTLLNINTIEKEVFAAMDLGIDSQAFLDERDKDAFTSVEDFEQRMNITLEDEQKAYLAVSTNYFSAEGQVSLGEKLLVVHSLFYRDKLGQTYVISRTLGDVY